MATVGSLDLDDPNDLALFIVLLLLGIAILFTVLGCVYYFCCYDGARGGFFSSRRRSGWRDGGRRDWRDSFRREKWRDRSSRRFRPYTRSTPAYSSWRSGGMSQYYGGSNGFTSVMPHQHYGTMVPYQQQQSAMPTGFLTSPGLQYYNGYM